MTGAVAVAAAAVARASALRTRLAQLAKRRPAKNNKEMQPKLFGYAGSTKTSSNIAAQHSVSQVCEHSKKHCRAKLIASFNACSALQELVEHIQSLRLSCQSDTVLCNSNTLHSLKYLIVVAEVHASLREKDQCLHPQVFADLLELLCFEVLTKCC
jgi:hypothetical protein